MDKYPVRAWIARYGCWLLLAAVCIANGVKRNHPAYDRVIAWDQEGYFKYLQAIFIQGGFADLQGRYPGYFPPVESTGRHLIKYTSGVALMQLPFFLPCHLYALATGQATGESPPYGLAIHLAALAYFLLGLWLVYRVLLRYVSPLAARGTVLLVGLGTQLLWYASGEPGMSHIYSFCLFALLLWGTPLWIETPTVGRSLLLGFVLGFILLIRPTNGVIALWPLSWLLSHPAAHAHWRRHAVPLLLAGLAGALLAWLPQLIYWKHVSGYWLYWTYSEEGFHHLGQPRLLQVLFSVRNGWLTYTPLMAVALGGLVYLRNTHRAQASTLVIIGLITWYVCAAWWMWWFGGSFGYRAFIEYYTLLAIPLAMVVQQVLALRRTARGLAIAVLVLYVYVNIGLTDRYSGDWSDGCWRWQDYRALIGRVLTFG
ncbi:MAG: hypothetical protein KF690_09530 [Bacteroidetes bacterium]|nr:hypothetical protein [Bacteroidota bacterium]